VSLVNPESLPRPVGYSHAAVCRGTAIVLAGQVGWDAACRFPDPPDLVGQFAQALDNLLAALRAAGGTPADLAQLRIFVTDVPAYRARLRELGAAYRTRLGRRFPAMVLVGVRELFDPRALIEIEGLAYVD